jgi:glutathione synthase/RimK-type ligase-like ATP-grasp enzyme
MKTLFVINRPTDWPSDTPGASVVTASDYLTAEGHHRMHCDRVINLCDCERHQGQGYYVSLLAEARGHRPLPAVRTIEDLHSTALAGLLARDVEELVQDVPRRDGAERFELDSYFGRDPDERHPATSQQLFALVKAPLLRASFAWSARGWRLSAVCALHAADLSADRRAAAARAAAEFLSGSRRARPRSAPERPFIGILHDEAEPEPPSNPLALHAFQHAAGLLGMRAELIDRNALHRLEEFDGLFIRDTTHTGHYTYEFSRHAAALGLVVIDDPDSIVQCNNKVYLNELMARHRVPVPRTMIVHRDNLEQIVPTLGLPCILKQPDGAFSLGVRKAESANQLYRQAAELLDKSELIIAQEFLPTSFDWRVGVLDRRVLFVCKYFMAPKHWQVIKRGTGGRQEGHTVAVSVGEAPEGVVRTALRAANLIGAGLYGVDLKQVGDQCYVIEVNDNPNVDAGNEDGILKDALYREIMGVFFRRVSEHSRAVAA